MYRFYSTFIVLFFAFSVVAQSDKEVAVAKAKEAIKMMDNGKIKESIKLLEECKKLDSQNFIYPYEIAYAHFLNKDYKKAIKILKKTKKYPNINSRVYQMSGNCYSYMGNPKEAINQYEEGMKLFPNSGILHLEKGNVFLAQQKYMEAIKNYEKGIEVEPTFPSNYFRLAKLFLSSNDKLSGLIYGELFMNLERTTARTQEMSELLYKGYQAAITLGEEESKIEFCDVVLDASQLTEEGEMRLPFCAIFGKSFIMTIIDKKELNLTTLSNMRQQFLANYFAEDATNYPNLLFQYHKEMKDNNVFEAYNHYIFQMGASEEFKAWKTSNEGKYEDFVSWYTNNKNEIEITAENRFLR